MNPKQTSKNISKNKLSKVRQARSQRDLSPQPNSFQDGHTLRFHVFSAWEALL